MRDWPRYTRFCLALLLALITVVAPFATPQAAQQQAGTQPTAAAPDLPTRLAAIEKAVDERRQALGIPGASLVIVKDDKVIYMKGLGLRDLEHRLPVTPDTLFPIGSATKAFTAMAAVMTADDGKLSLDDSPRRFLPDFKLRDPDADAKITIRDLLSHRSGLNRTDLAMVTGVLNREELIRVVGMAKPTAKLGEKFQYQNIMYTAAGEAVARANNTTWDKVIAERIFKPLAMKASVTTDAAMQRSSDFSYGYEYKATTKQTRRLPMREIPAAAPAGAINSNARDMAQWLRLMLGGGVFEGKRLVSEKGFHELVTEQINVAGTVAYGLGWFLRQWDGHQVIEHGGNIDGYNAQVGFMPDQRLGFVLLTNVTASPLVSFTMETVWSNLVGRPGPATTVGNTTVDPKTEAGTYRLAEASLNMEVSFKDRQLVLTVPGQPPYPLENLGGRRYKLGAPAPDGFFATFRPAREKEGETEMYLEQPHGNHVLQRVPPAEMSKANENTNPGPLGELLGSYQSDQGKTVIEIAMVDSKVSLVVPGQPAYPLEEKEKDKLHLGPLPETYWVSVKRDAAGKITGLVVNQPEGQLGFTRLADAKVAISVDDMLVKVIAAYGGEANLRKHHSSVTTITLDFENQGVTGEGVISTRSPNSFGSQITLIALGRKIGTVVNYFDGAGGGQNLSFAPEEIFSGKRLDDLGREADVYGPADWQKNFKQITIKRMMPLAGEDCYVVQMVPEKGNAVTVYISSKTFLVLRRDTVISSDTSGVDLPRSETYSDFRTVDGVVVPFRSVGTDIANGNVITEVKEVKFDVAIPDAVFQKPAR
jgi:CubicO group peptidase (beta-lactamase class C family)